MRYPEFNPTTMAAMEPQQHGGDYHGAGDTGARPSPRGGDGGGNGATRAIDWFPEVHY